MSTSMCRMARGRRERATQRREAVAEICARLIGAYTVRDRNGTPATLPCRRHRAAGPYRAPNSGATSAGWKPDRSWSRPRPARVFRRQEIQDLIALASTLADARDTLALGALLRGPLVGLTEEALLDALAALPMVGDRHPRLHLWLPITEIRTRCFAKRLRYCKAWQDAHARRRPPCCLRGRRRDARPSVAAPAWRSWRRKSAFGQRRCFPRHDPRL